MSTSFAQLLLYTARRPLFPQERLWLRYHNRSRIRHPLAETCALCRFCRPSLAKAALGRVSTPGTAIRVRAFPRRPGLAHPAVQRVRRRASYQVAPPPAPNMSGGTTRSIRPPAPALRWAALAAVPVARSRTVLATSRAGAACVPPALIRGGRLGEGRVGFQ